MQQRRAHPLFSRVGCGATLILAVTLVLILAFQGGGPFSPGPLTAVTRPTTLAKSNFQSHAQFEQDCAQCHAPWRGITADRCQQCHTNVAMQRETATGLHGKLVDTGRCQSCHTDHKGRTAEITLLALDSFDHLRLTNFSLAHHETDYDGTALTCQKCHTEGLSQASAIECVSCHETADPTFLGEHTQLFGSDCLGCHDGRDTMADFDHAQVFPLEGAHTPLACQDCHANQTFMEPARACAACHAEPAVHAGLFGQDCARCHTAVAWTPAQLTQHTFPLNHGADSDLACETCHTQTYTEYTCYNCHEHTPTEVRETHLEEGITDYENCIECHPTGLEEESEND